MKILISRLEKTGGMLLMPQKFLSLEVGRFLAALLVVIFHVGVTTSKSKYFSYYALPVAAGGFSGVDFFFVLSGFVIVTAHYADFSRQDKNSAALNFLWKRFVRLYPALWAVLLVLAPAIWFVPSLQWAGPVSEADLLSAFAITPVVGERIVAVEWTLRYEVVFYALFALLIWQRFLGLIGFASLIGLSLISYAVTVQGLFGFFVTPYPILFLCGAIISYASRNHDLKFGIPALTIGSVVFLYRLWDCAMDPAHDGPRFWDTTFFGAGATLIIYGLVASEIRRPMSVPNWLQYLGRASYAIYLVHFPVVSVGAKLAMKVRSYVPDMLLFILISAFAVTCGILFHEFVEKPLIASTRRLRPNWLGTASRASLF